MISKAFFNIFAFLSFSFSASEAASHSCLLFGIFEIPFSKINFAASGG